jgi:hypothetical protein
LIREQFGLQHVLAKERQFYRFGQGPPILSTESRWLPVGVCGRPLLLSAWKPSLPE